MIIQHIKLRGSVGIQDGLGKEEINVDFTKFDPGIIAICGPNGAGKTTFIENLTPFRFLKSRPGSLAKQFYLKDSCRDLLVKIKDDEYRLLIYINGASKSGKLESVVYKNGEPLNPDGKEGTYNEIVNDLFGDPDLYFSSLFMPQRRLPFSKLEPAKRKELLLDLIGQHLIQQKCDSAVQASRGLKNDILKVETELSTLADSLKKADELKTNIETTEKAIESKSKEEFDLKINIELLQAEIDRLTEKSKEQAVTESSLKQAQERLSALEDELSKLSEAYFKKSKQFQIFIDQDSKTLEQLQRQLSPEKLQQINQRIIEAEDVRQNYQKMIEISERYRDLQLKVSELKSNMNQAKADHESKNNQIQLEYERIEDKLTDITKDCESKEINLEATLNRKTRATDILDTVPCQKDEAIAQSCSDCQFLKDAIKASSEIVELSTQLGKMKAEHETEIKKQENLRDRAVDKVRSIIDWPETEQATEYRSSMNKIEDEIRSLNFDQTRFTVIRTKYQSYEANNPEKEKQAYLDLQNRIDSLTEKIKEKSAQRDEIESEREEKTAELRDQIESVRAEVETLKALIDPQVNIQLKEKSELVKSETARHKQLSDSLAMMAGRLEILKSKLEELDDQQAEYDRLKGVLADLQSNQADWDHLANNLSKNGGYQSLLVEAAGAEMTPFANELLANYEVPWTIEIATSRPSADGKKMVEGFFVIVNTPSGPRELSDLSGGQEVWIDEVLYDSIGNMLRRRSGLSLLTAIKDEADGALDGERALAYLKAIEASHHASGLHHTILISHRSELQDIIPQRIRFTPGQGIATEID